MNQTDPLSTNSESTESVVKVNNYSKLSFFVVALLCLMFGFGGYLLGSNLDNSDDKAIVVNNMVANDTDNSKEGSDGTMGIKENVPVNDVDLDNKVVGTSIISFAKIGEQLYLNYLISPIDNGFGEMSKSASYIYGGKDGSLVDNIDANNYSWNEVFKYNVYEQEGVSTSDFYINDQILDFRIIPNTEDFLFILTQYAKADSIEDKEIVSTKLFYYSVENGLKTVVMPNRELEKTFYAKIDTISSDGNYVSLKLLECYACGPTPYLPLLLVNLKTLETKNIGVVHDIVFGENGEYKYKENVPVECPEPQLGSCIQDLDTLPYIKGQF